MFSHTHDLKYKNSLRTRHESDTPTSQQVREIVNELYAIKTENKKSKSIGNLMSCLKKTTGVNSDAYDKSISEGTSDVNLSQISNILLSNVNDILKCICYINMEMSQQIIELNNKYSN